ARDRQPGARAAQPGPASRPSAPGGLRAAAGHGVRQFRRGHGGVAAAPAPVPPATRGAQHRMSNGSTQRGSLRHLATRDPVVMVVDDQESNVRLVGTVLTQAGFEVVPAMSGEQALKRASAAPPDLVLLDMLMPGMNGID